jgi:hypothetical protein
MLSSEIGVFNELNITRRMIIKIMASGSQWRCTNIGMVLANLRHVMAISAKILTILIFLTLLLGTGCVLALLAPLPVAHAMSVFQPD